MGITATLIRISKEKFFEIRDDEKKILEFVDEQDMIENNPKEHSIRKAWEGIYYLLYDRKWFGKHKKDFGTLLGGYSFNNYTDTGYGEPIIQDIEYVEQVYKHIKQFTCEDLKQKFNPKEFSRKTIYPMDKNWGEDDWEYILCYWEGLTEFYEQACKNDELILLYFS